MTTTFESATISSTPARTASLATAIVGLGVRLPGADSPSDFWSLIREGRTTFRRVDPQESRRWGHATDRLADPAFVPVTSSLRAPDVFDADYFGIPAHEARTMDPQHRLLLETVWVALEDAGHAGDYGSLRVGLFASVTPSTYLSGPLTQAGLWDASDPNYGVLLGNDKDFAATRTAYTLGLTGPCLTIQTACSSSLVAVHSARMSLAAGECDLAIVAGSSVSLPHLGGYVHRSGSIFSAAGTCRPFDAHADGTVKGNGALAVVLRRSDDARRAGDRPYADVLGSAVNNDGRGKAGFAAPGVDGQSAAISAALRDAGIDADRVGYVEAHGTGTALGDPLELRALSRAHAGATSPCRLGSLKATMGHLDAAAGVAGLAKAALIAHHREFPPMAGFEAPNPLLELDRTRFTLCSEASPAGHAHIGVSSFGMGGTNAHAVVASTDGTTQAPSPRGFPPPERHVVRVYGPDAQTAAVNRDRLRSFLVEHTDVDLTDVVRTLSRGRRRDAYQVEVSAVDAAEAARALAAAPATPSQAVLDSQPVGGQRVVGLPTSTQRPTRHWVDAAPPTETEDVDVDAAEGENPRGNVGDPARLTELIALCMGELLGSGPLSHDEDFFLAGADSLLGIDLLGRLQDDHDITLEYADLEACRTPAMTAAHIVASTSPSEVAPAPTAPESGASDVAARAESGRPVIAPVRLAGGDGRNLFVIHPAGGTTSCYVDAARQVTGELAVWGLNFPSHLRGTAPSIRELAELYLGSICSVQPDGPYLIGGYSFGGNLAAELALQLEARGQRVERLVLIDAHPPHAYIGGACAPGSYLKAFPELLRSVLGDHVVIDRPERTWTSPAEVVDAVVVPELGVTAREQLTEFYDVWCDNHAALKHWCPERDLTCPVTVLEATVPEPPEVLELLAIDESYAREWSQYVRGPIELIPVEGDHYSIFRSPGAVATIAKALSDDR